MAAAELGNHPKQHDGDGLMVIERRTCQETFETILLFHTQHVPSDKPSDFRSMHADRVQT